jgi:hypothetical protein
MTCKFRLDVINKLLKMLIILQCNDYIFGAPWNGYCRKGKVILD